MSRESQRQETVFEACRRVVERGLPLTARNVRDELGGGSFTTIVPHISAYRLKLSGETAIRSSLPPPPQELENAAKKIVHELWLKLRMANDAEMKEAVTKMEQKLKSLQSELDESKEEVAGHAAEIVKLEQSLSASESKIQEQLRRHAEKEGQIQLITEQLRQRDIEIKSLLERAVRAESQFIQSNGKGKKNKGPANVTNKQV